MFFLERGGGFYYRMGFLGDELGRREGSRFLVLLCGFGFLRWIFFGFLIFDGWWGIGIFRVCIFSEWG